MKFSRTWAMPNRSTFSIPPIREFVQRWINPDYKQPTIVVDPFYGSNLFTVDCSNDLNPNIKADFHLDAEEFLRNHAPMFDVLLFDPPYSPRQISECYKNIGLPVTMQTTQNAVLYSRVREVALTKANPNSVVLSFGWNSVGMGKKRGFEIGEILLVCHGGAHNDTICLAERKTA